MRLVLALVMGVVLPLAPAAAVPSRGSEFSSLDAVQKFVFGYRITIRNEGDSTVQLLSRHWHIIDADGEQHEVRGEGVIGHTPVLEPGQEFEYTSFCPLETEWGTMEGEYQMMRDDGWMFEAKIGRFILNTTSSQSTTLSMPR